MAFEFPKQISSRAFGDGSHPTTLLCARAVDLLCREHPVRSFLDVGTGTGILARIARSRGAAFVVGTDIDPIAREAAQANSALDASPVDLVISDQAPDRWGPRFELIAANILEAVLIDLAPSLVRALAPGGKLLLSGFTRLQAPALEVAFSNFGLKLARNAYDGEWALLLFQN